MEFDNYLNQLSLCQDKEIELKSPGYSHPIEKNIKGYIFFDKFYTPEEYNSLQIDMSNI